MRWIFGLKVLLCTGTVPIKMVVTCPYKCCKSLSFCALTKMFIPEFRVSVNKFWGKIEGTKENVRQNQ
jgi:hypothetical protein